MSDRLNIVFFGSSLVSAYWNGAATYYRGIIRALAGRGHRVIFYEPDAWDRQKHRDIDPPQWAKVVVYSAQDTRDVDAAIRSAAGADLVIKASGVGVFDDYLEKKVLELQSPTTRVVFWDVDAPATLERVRGNPADPFRACVSRYDMVLTYGGGRPVIDAYEELGARRCVPIYNALDPQTHHPEPADDRFACDLALLANRLPDREARIDEFFFKPAEACPEKRFVLGGSGWDGRAMPANVRYLGHVYTADHNALNASARCVLNVNRQSMASVGFSPPTRVFEAAGAGACLITDAWEGLEMFLEPGREVLVAEDGRQVAAHLREVGPARSAAVGEAALARVLCEHTYDHRAEQLERLLLETPQPRGRASQAVGGA